MSDATLDTGTRMRLHDLGMSHVYEAHDALLAQLEQVTKERDDADERCAQEFFRGMAHGQAVMPKGTLHVVDSPEFASLRARAETAEAALAAANARVKGMRGLLWFAHHEFNAIRARSGAPMADGIPLVSPDWWDELTEMFAGELGEWTPWPSPEAQAILDARAILKETTDAR